jgi:hypothetical protein
MEEIEKNRINEKDYWLFQNSYEVNLTVDDKKNIYTYKQGDIILTATKMLAAIKHINLDEKTFSVLSLPIHKDSVLISVNPVEKYENISKLFRY